jgi:hypothetical protein
MSTSKRPTLLQRLHLLNLYLVPTSPNHSCLHLTAQALSILTGDLLAIHKKRKATRSSSPSSSASGAEEEATQQSSNEGLFISPEKPKSKTKSSEKTASKSASKRKSRKSEPIKKVTTFDVDDEETGEGSGEDEDGGGGGTDSQ